jgi:O-antigen/teichoic acid export membrane protein
MMKLEYRKRTILMVLPNLLINIISIISIMYLLKTDLYMGKIVPSAIINILLGLIILLIIFNKSKVFNNRIYWSYSYKVSLPIVIHGLSLNILSQSDRIMLTSLIGASDTGVYSLIYNFGMLITVIGVSLESVWIPWFTNKMKEKNIFIINENVKKYIYLMTFAVCSIIILSPELIRIMSPKEYWVGIKIVPQIVVACYIIFLYTLYVNVEHFYKKTNIIALFTLIAATLNIILNGLFIPKFGFYAAATTTILSYLVLLILHYNYSKKIEPTLFPISNFMTSVKIITLTIAGFYFFQNHLIIRLFYWVIFAISTYREVRKYQMD